MDRPILQHPDEFTAQPPRRGHAEPAADDLTEQRMIEPHVQAVAILLYPHQPTRLRGLDGVGSDHVRQCVEVEWFTKAQQAQRMLDSPRAARSIRVSSSDASSEVTAARPRSCQTPRTWLKVPGLHRALDEVADEKRVAAGRFPHQVGAEPLHPAAKSLLDQPDTLLLGERAEMQALEIAVLPQRRDRVRVLLRRDCRDDPR